MMANTKPGRRLRPSIRLANAPCSWGQLEFDNTWPKVAQTSAPTGPQVMREIAESGYIGTELGDWGFYPTDPSALSDELQLHALELMAAFVPVALARPEAHAAGIEEALRVARLLSGVHPGAFVVLADDNCSVAERAANAGRIRPEHGLDEAAWEVFAQGAETLARRVLDETGVRTVFHFHCGGYVETPAEVDALMERTDPKLLGLCFDTGHYAYAGGDPLEGLRRHYERVWHVHFKDLEPDVAAVAAERGWGYLDAVRNGVFCELGRGSVDFRGVIDLLTARDYEGWVVVEQDVLPGMGSPLESALRNRDFLRRLGL